MSKILKAKENIEIIILQDEDEVEETQKTRKDWLPGIEKHDFEAIPCMVLVLLYLLFQTAYLSHPVNAGSYSEVWRKKGVRDRQKKTTTFDTYMPVLYSLCSQQFSRRQIDASRYEPAYHNFIVLPKSTTDSTVAITCNVVCNRKRHSNIYIRIKCHITYVNE